MGNIRCAGMCALWRWSPETQKETRHTARLLLWKNGMVKYSQRSHNAVGDVQFFQISNVFSAQADVQRTGRVIQVAGLRGCCFSKRMRKFFRKNEKSMLQFCNKNSKRKGRLQWVKKPL